MNNGNFQQERAALLDAIARDAEDTRLWTGRNKFSDAVMAAMANVPRHAFVPEAEIPRAYLNRPLPIGCGQTISQPLIVALMTDLLDLEPGSRVLEIGTGCGYQAAVLAEVAGRVFTVEAVEALARSAQKRLSALGYDTIEVRHGDGFDGWPDKAPFDAVIVTSAPDHIPHALIEQLGPGGRMVVPVGPPFGPQMLVLCTKNDDGDVTTRKVLPVSFVPMIHDRAGR